MCQLFLIHEVKLKLIKNIAMLLVQISISAGMLPKSSFSHLSAPIVKLDRFQISNVPIFTKTFPSNSNENMNKVSVKPLSRLKFTCTAPYLTKWTSSIIFRKTEFNSHYSRRLTVDPPSYQTWEEPEESQEYINTFYYETPDETESHLGGFGFVRCESVRNNSLATEIYVYTILPKSCTQHVEQQRFINPGASSTNKHKAAEGLDLSRKDLNKNPRITTEIIVGSEVSPDSLIYDETVGFSLNYTGNSTYPASYKCMTMYDEIEYWVRRKDGRLIAVYEENLEDESGGHSGISCVDPQSKYGPNRKVLSNSIIMINCNFPYLCDSVKQCFGGGCSGRSVPMIYSGLLPNLVFPFNHGIVRCDGGRDTSYTYHYTFLGLDRRRHWLRDLFKERNKKAIIDLRRIDKIYHTNDIVTFTCEISSFVLISNIKFALNFTFGQPTLADGGDSQIENNSQLAISSRTISIKLTKNMTGIICMAPWFNSTEWVQTSRNFDVKDVVKPRIDKSHGNKSYVFYIGEKHAILNCIVLASEPSPIISWIFPNQEMRSRVNWSSSHNESFIKFPEIDESFEGKYVCTAKNGNGTDNMDSYEIYVDVQDGSFTWPKILAVILASLVTLASVVGLIYYSHKYSDAKKKLRDLTDEEVHEYIHGHANYAEINDPNIDNIQFMAFNPIFEIQESDLIINKSSVLGEGEYGKVYKGTFKGQSVAVKTTKPSTDITYFKYLLSELKIICYITKHENIVDLKGAVTSRIKERVLPIVVELSPLGNLQAFIRKIAFEFKSLVVDDQLAPNLMQQCRSVNNPCVFTTLNFINWSRQIAAGMEHLASLKVIHGDLATRNLLLFSNDVVKITDFGLSRQLYEYSKYVKTKKVPLPWRWLALESLRFMEFSIESDVWSYGVTIWEIFSLASVPYPEIIDPRGFLKLLMNGMRLEKPIHAPKNIYDQMQRCWNIKPDERPSFTELKYFFQRILATER